MFVCSSDAGFLLLVFDSAPAALSQFFAPSLFDNFRPQPLVGLLRGDVVDARMVVLRIVPSKVPFEIDDGLAIVEESTGIFRGSSNWTRPVLLIKGCHLPLDWSGNNPLASSLQRSLTCKGRYLILFLILVLPRYDFTNFGAGTPPSETMK